MTSQYQQLLAKLQPGSSLISDEIIIQTREGLEKVLQKNGFGLFQANAGEMRLVIGINRLPNLAAILDVSCLEDIGGQHRPLLKDKVIIHNTGQVLHFSTFSPDDLVGLVSRSL